MWPFKRKQAAVAYVFDIEPVLTKRTIKVPAKHQTFADQLDWLCHQHKATYEIARPNPTEVIVRLVMDDGHHIVSGRGRTTGEAVAAVRQKMEPK